MKVVRFPLRPMSHFRFGEIGLDSKSTIATTSAYPHSDTVFASLVNCYAQAHTKNEVDDFVLEFTSGQTNISSMFYYLQIEDVLIYFLPKPLFYNLQAVKNENFKKLKKIEFISTGVWEEISDVNDFFNENKCSIIQGEFVVLVSELNNSDAKNIQIYSKTTQPKVPIRFIDSKASIYFETDVEIAGEQDDIEIGYYFLYQAEHEECLKEAIELMVLSGIGGGRSTGTGELGSAVFDNISCFDFTNLQNQAYCNVSMVIPEDENEFKQFEYYEIQLRGGRTMEHGGKQQFIRMIKEGGIIKAGVEGKMAVLGIDENGNSVLRNGKCFALPVKRN